MYATSTCYKDQRACTRLHVCLQAKSMHTFASLPAGASTGMGNTSSGMGNTGTGTGSTGTGMGSTGTGMGNTGTGAGGPHSLLYFSTQSRWISHNWMSHNSNRSQALANKCLHPLPAGNTGYGSNNNNAGILPSLNLVAMLSLSAFWH